MFPAAVRKVLDVFILVISVITLFFLAKNSIAYINVFASTGRTTAVLHLSYIMIYCVAPISCVWQIFNYILVSFFHYSEKEVIEAISEEEFKEAREKE